MLRHCMLCMAKVFEGKFLRENFEKWCNLVRFGVYFDQMFLKIVPKISALYKLIVVFFIILLHFLLLPTEKT